MTVELPEDVALSIQLHVTSGRFASVDDAVAAAWRAYVRQREKELTEAMPPAGNSQGSLGAMREAAEELDEVVAEAMNERQRPWRLPPGE